MTYFIVEAPYDQCFDIFFQNELGYPNFYRLTELLPSQEGEGYQNLTLIVPYPNKETPILEKISARVSALGMKYHPFGEHLETAFLFDSNGQLQINSQFKQALTHAVAQFLNNQLFSDS